MTKICVKKKRDIALPDDAFNRHVGDVCWAARMEAGLTTEQIGAKVNKSAKEMDDFERGIVDEVFVMLTFYGLALNTPVLIELID